MSRRSEPHPLSPDDAGEGGPSYRIGSRRINEAFLMAMRQAVRSGRERARYGIRKADPADACVMAKPFVPAFVPTRSVIG